LSPHIINFFVHFVGSHTELHTGMISLAPSQALTALTIADSSPLLCQYFFTPYLLANRGQKFCNNGMQQCLPDSYYANNI